MPPDGAEAAATAGPGGGASASGRAWVWRGRAPGAAPGEAPEDDARIDREGLAIAQALPVHDLVGRLLARQGIGIEAAADHLAPTLRRMLPDPSALHGMDAAARLLADAVESGATVGIFGDYDVDGICSTAIAATCLRALGCRVETHIPDRIAEGYGPNAAAIGRMIEAGASLVLCVDCGTAAGAVLEPFAARAAIVVLDHHLAEAGPRGIAATVNPNLPPDRSGLGMMCAAGIVFLTLVATLRTLRGRGFFASRPEPALFDLLDLAALATVCDVVPLVGVNRALVAQGLRVMARRARPGIAALLAAASVDGAPDARACGYGLGPRINAGGRIGDAGLGLALLLEPDRTEADRLALALDAVNRERREVEAGVLEAAMREAERQVAEGRSCVLLAGEDWHPGIVGIVASRLRQALNRPACVGGRAGGVVKGSGRSVPGLDLGAAIIAAREHGLLLTGGGHAMAAGYSHAPEGREALHDFLDRRLAAAASRPRREPVVLDAALAPRAAGPEIAREIARLAPFGAGNEEPCLLLRRARLARVERVGARRTTIRATLTDEVGDGRLRAMRFGGEGDPVAALIEAAAGRALDLAGALRVERWNGAESVIFAIEDARFA